jgi:hypothetical protein
MRLQQSALGHTGNSHADGGTKQQRHCQLVEFAKRFVFKHETMILPK